jgi:bacteriocin biosynthesis cyclodehydratase domain-containing protein
MYPRIKPHYSIIAHSPDAAELRYGVWNATSVTLRDDTRSGSLTRLLLRLEGSLSADEIAAAEGVARHDVDALIAQLVELDVIESEPGSAIDLMLDRLQPIADGTAAARAAMPVALVGDAGLVAAIAPILRATKPDLAVSLPTEATPPDLPLDGEDDTLAFQAELARFAGWRGSLIVAPLRTVDLRLLQAVNRVCLAVGAPFLPAALDGPFVFVGPLTVPNRSACFDCFETRVMMNLREAANYQQYKRAVVEHLVRYGQIPAEPALSQLLVSHTAIEALNFLLTGHSNLIDKVLSIYLPTMEFAYHEVLRLPNCRSCAPLAAATRRELYFDAAAALEPAD